MPHRFSLRSAAAACAVFAVLVLGSCQFPGFLGDSFTIEGDVYEEGSTGELTGWDSRDGLVTLAMMSSLDGKIDLFTGTLVDGVLSVDVTVPDDSDLRSWADILPPTATSTVTPDTAQACVINSIIYEDSTNSIEYRTPDATTWVFWAYSDTDAQLTAQGSDLELPGGAYGSMELDLELKKGWNLVTLTRSPETAAKGMSHIDTYSVGDLPDGLKLIYPYQPPL